LANSPCEQINCRHNDYIADRVQGGILPPRRLILADAEVGGAWN
jgi:hypothetical protein